MFKNANEIKLGTMGVLVLSMLSGNALAVDSKNKRDTNSSRSSTGNTNSSWFNFWNTNSKAPVQSTKTQSKITINTPKSSFFSSLGSSSHAGS